MLRDDAHNDDAAGGIELRALTAGDPTHPALILLHGGPLAKEILRPVIDGFDLDSFVLGPTCPASATRQEAALRRRPRATSPPQCWTPIGSWRGGSHQSA